MRVSLRHIAGLLAVILGWLSPNAKTTGSYDDLFSDTTLRLDYVLAGSPSGERMVALRSAYSMPGWAGRRVNMPDALYIADGMVTMTDHVSGDTLYRTGFSTLFHEWLSTDESANTARAMDHTVLLPMPREKALVTVELRDNSRSVIAATTHPVDPSDILIRPIDRNRSGLSEVRELHIGTDSHHGIDFAILSEAYTAAEIDSFMTHANRAVESILRHEPFHSMADRLNFRAVFVPSAQSGVSVPRLGEWHDTSLDSHFSTFYSDRYLTSPSPRAMHDALAGVPYEHIIVLANTTEYGGGGIYNAYTLTAGGNPLLPPVVVHELGHSFGGLGDEYFYEGDVMSDSYPVSVEPWNPNITTMADFSSKWRYLLPDTVPVPTPVDMADSCPIGVYEGGGYSAHGVYRPADRCRMRDNTWPSFCDVCIESLRRMIIFNTEPQ